MPSHPLTMKLGLAYTTNASGHGSGYRADGHPGEGHTISTDGVVPLAWMPTAGDLSIESATRLRKVTVKLPAGVTPGSSRRIFTIPPSLLWVDVAADGQRMFAVRGGMMYSGWIVKQGALK